MRRSVSYAIVLFAVAVVLSPSVCPAKGKPAPTPCPDDVSLAVAAACPCNGALQGGALVAWKNHGQYVRCVAHFRNALRKSGCLSRGDTRAIVRCAAGSSCGKADAEVVCCTPTLGPCSDPVPDGTPAGTCGNDPARSCDLADDCMVTVTTFVDDPVDCAAGGGVVEGAGAACSVCGVH